MLFAMAAEGDSGQRGDTGLTVTMVCGLAACAIALAAIAHHVLQRPDPAPADTVRIGEHTIEARLPPRIFPLDDVAPLPPIHEIDGGNARRAAFIDYLAPIVAAVNDEIRQRRAAVILAARRLRAGATLDAQARGWLDRMAQHYRVRDGTLDQRIGELRQRIDIIPVELAIAQGAIESAWGTSRFARQGNNIFGKWCFEPGCGIVPARRPANANYEVESYDDVADSIRDYIHHLNSHPNYRHLRERRAAARARGRRPDGIELAAGLETYSAKGREYVASVRGVIRRNELRTTAARLE